MKYQFRSALAAVLILIPAVQSIAQQRGYGESHQVQQEPPFLHSLVAVVTIDGDITITPEVSKQLESYRQSLKAIEAWERKAIELTKTMKENENTPQFFHYPTQFNPRMVGQHSFPEEVVKQMPPRPEWVRQPNATPLNMSIKVTNTSEKPVHFDTAIYSDFASISFSLKGPSAYQFSYGLRARTMEIRPGKPIEIPAGESIEFDVEGTQFGDRGQRGYWIISEPGEYELTATICVNKNFRSRDRIRSTPVRFNVIAETPDQETIVR